MINLKVPMFYLRFLKHHFRSKLGDPLEFAGVELSSAYKNGKGTMG